MTISFVGITLLFLLITLRETHCANERSLTMDQFRCMFPAISSSRAEDLLPHLNNALNDWEINNVNRRSLFLAQVRRKTQGLTILEEPEENNPWCQYYEGGCLYRGRGAFMLRGRSIYRRASDHFGQDFEYNPRLMSFSMWAFQTAGWWWNLHGLNNLADILDHAGIIRALNDGVYDEEEYRLSRQFSHSIRQCLNPSI